MADRAVRSALKRGERAERGSKAYHARAGRKAEGLSLCLSLEPESSAVTAASATATAAAAAARTDLPPRSR